MLTLNPVAPGDGRAVGNPSHHPWLGPAQLTLLGAAGLGLVREGGQGLYPPCALLMAATSSWSVLPRPPLKDSSRASIFNSSQHFTTLTTGQLLPTHTPLLRAAVQPHKICLLLCSTTKQEDSCSCRQKSRVCIITAMIYPLRESDCYLFLNQIYYFHWEKN